MAKHTHSSPPSPETTGDDLAFRDLFELAPISLWLEDFSGIKALFNEWRAAGISDVDTYFDAYPEQVEACSAAIRVLAVNRRTLEMFGARDQDELVANLHKVFRDDMHDQHAHDMAALWNGKPGFTSQTVNYSLDGRRIDVQLNARILPGHEHDWKRVMISLEDISDRVRAERGLKFSEQYARGLFEHSPVSLWVENFSGVRALLQGVRDAGITDFPVFLDVHPEFVSRCMQEIQVIDVNRQTLALFGADSKEHLLGNLDRVFRDDMREPFVAQLIDLWNDRLFHQRETVNYSLSGVEVNVYLQFSVLPGHEDNWDRVLIALTDITARKKAEAYLEFLGRHDALTKLYNRAYYDEDLMRLTRKGPYPISVVIADLNGLKASNDVLGHAAGDALLRRAGEVLKKAMGDGICAARIGGDEFAILLPGCDERGAREVVERIHAVTALNNQFYPGAVLSFSLGIGTCVQGESLTKAIHAADERMYAAKREYYNAGDHDRRT
ncbi:MAG: diguanylate cyclase domain-containing protein [Rhodocyclaceae bacterium]